MFPSGNHQIKIVRGCASLDGDGGGIFAHSRKSTPQGMERMLALFRHRYRKSIIALVDLDDVLRTRYPPDRDTIRSDFVRFRAWLPRW
jgi:hypothetical protein